MWGRDWRPTDKTLTAGHIRDFGHVPLGQVTVESIYLEYRSHVGDFRYIPFTNRTIGALALVRLPKAFIHGTFELSSGGYGSSVYPCRWSM